jgi:hypothetical protein
LSTKPELKEDKMDEVLVGIREIIRLIGTTSVATSAVAIDSAVRLVLRRFDFVSTARKVILSRAVGVSPEDIEVTWESDDRPVIKVPAAIRRDLIDDIIESIHSKTGFKPVLDHYQDTDAQGSSSPAT